MDAVFACTALVPPRPAAAADAQRRQANSTRPRLTPSLRPAPARQVLARANVAGSLRHVTHIMPSMRHSALSLFPRFLDASARLRSPAV